MTLTPQQRQELERSRDDMRNYAMTLPEGSEEREEYEAAIASANATLRSYSQVSEPTDTEAPETDADDDDAEEEADDENVPLDGETEAALAALAAQLRAEGYDVGDDPEDLVADDTPRNYSQQVVIDPQVAEMQRDDIDERVQTLVEGGKLLPYEGDQIKVALYALLDATPEGGASGGLRVYSREEGGVTPSSDRRAAVRDLLTTLGAREDVGLTRSYSRDTSSEEANPASALTLTLPDDVPVNPQSAHLANAINALAQERNISFAAATKIYEREKGKVTLKKY